MRRLVLIILIFSLLLIGCNTSDMAGQGYKVKGKWLVLELDNNNGLFSIEEAHTQAYNKETARFFEKYIKEEFTHELEIQQGNKVSKVNFNVNTAEIGEQFGKRIELVEYTEKTKKIITVKVPIENFNTRQQISMIIKEVRRGKIQKFSRIQKFLYSKNRITGRAISNVCNNMKEIVPNHNSDDENRINLIFVGSNYPTKEEFVLSLPHFIDYNKKGITYYTVMYGENMGEVTEHGLLNYEPFASNANKFNFWYVDEILEPYKLKNTFLKQCNCINHGAFSEEVKACGFNNFKVVSLCFDVCRSHATLGGTSSNIGTYSIKDMYDSYYKGTDEKVPFKPVSTVFLHELGHNFKLKDEYLKDAPDAADKPGFPNCAPSKEIGNMWWKELFPDLEFFEGCSYVENNVRFTWNSFMDAHFTAESFGPINEFYLCYKIFKAYGDVGGYCDNFLSKSLVPPEEVCGDGIDNNGNGKTDCQETKCKKLGCDLFITEILGEHWENGNLEYEFADSESYCSDGKDNDFNGKKDCEDPVCFGFACPEVCGDNQDNDNNGFTDCKDPVCDEGCKNADEPHEIAVCGGETNCYTNLPSDWLNKTGKEFFCETYGYGKYFSVLGKNYEEAALKCCQGLELDKGKYTNIAFKDVFMSPSLATAVKFYDCFSVEDCDNGLDEDGDWLIDCDDEECEC
jgi:hypothetical protein